MFNLFKELGYDQTLENTKPLTSGLYQIHLPHLSKPQEYQLFISVKRKTLAIEIKQSKLFVKAPAALNIQEIESFIARKQNWIMEKISKQRQLSQSQMFYRHGDPFMLFGNNYRLLLEAGRTFRQELNHENHTLTFVIPGTVRKKETYVKNKLKQFFMTLAQDYAIPRMAELSKQTQLRPSSVEFKYYRSRWGCCYHNGLIRINPWLLAAPKFVIDCVLIHELCHLKHLNHSKAFWDLNRQFCGHCKSSDAWLRQYGHVAMLK